MMIQNQRGRMFHRSNNPCCSPAIANGGRTGIIPHDNPSFHRREKVGFVYVSLANLSEVNGVLYLTLQISSFYGSNYVSVKWP